MRESSESKKDALSRLTRLNRSDTNGNELTVCPIYRTSTDWSYCLIEYPLAMSKQFYPSKVVQDFKGWTWARIASFCEGYLKVDTETGFYFL